jgi:hypothetical protein
MTKPTKDNSGSELWDGIKSTAAQTLVGATTAEPPDPTLITGNPDEITIRNEIPFSDLIFSFPTTQSTIGKDWYGVTIGNRLRFPAYIESFGDSYSPEWSTTSVFGRADPIPTYKATKRSITLNFTIPCYSEEDASANLKKINILIKNLYPSYERTKQGANILSSPPLARIKFANLMVNHKNPMKGLLGYITSFSTNMGIKENGVFVSELEALFPRAITVQLAFSPLHESTIGWDSTAMGNLFHGSDRFPYGTKRSYHGIINSVSDHIGMGAPLDEEKILKGGS